MRGRDGVGIDQSEGCVASVSLVTAWQWWPLVRDRGQRVSQQLCVPVTRPVTETISADTSTLSRMCCVTQCLGLVSVRQTFRSNGTAACTVTETSQLRASICLNSLRQTDGGIEPAVLGIFAVHCNLRRAFVVYSLFAIWQRSIEPKPEFRNLCLYCQYYIWWLVFVLTISTYYELFWLTSSCTAESWAIYFTGAAQYQVAEHLRAIIIKYYASLDRGKNEGRGQTLDEWHVSDPLYDNYNMDHLLHYINGSALELHTWGWAWDTISQWHQTEKL